MKTGLILEGGGMRGMFSCGVLDVMMERGLRFDGAAGISAGAVFGCNYKSGQIGRVLRYNLRFCRDPRYCSWRSWLKTGDLYGAEFCYHELPDRLDIFDRESFERDPLEFYLVCTDVATGEALYRRCEAADPERAKTPEFATLRTKRAYVSAAIDSLLLSQARDNARPVAVCDTTELEKKLAAEKGAAAAEPDQDEAARPEAAAPSDPKIEKRAAKPVAKKKRHAPARQRPAANLTPKERAMTAIGEGRYKEADDIIAAMLAEKPDDSAALNLRAVKETAEGRYRDAERTLDRAIQSNPRSHYAYYNMAVLMLRSEPPNVDGARRYYETGRAMGGPVDSGLEEAFSR